MRRERYLQDRTKEKVEPIVEVDGISYSQLYKEVFNNTYFCSLICSKFLDSLREYSSNCDVQWSESTFGRGGDWIPSGVLEGKVNIYADSKELTKKF